MIIFRKRAIIVGAVMTLIVLIALILWFCGYSEAHSWNNNAKHAVANLTEDLVEDDQCSYSCNCTSQKRKFPIHSGSHQTCQTCYYTCYDGAIQLRYLANEAEYNATFLKYNDYYSADEVAALLQTNYPVGSAVDVFYNSNDPTDVQLSLKDDESFFIAFWVLLSLVMATVGGWGSLELGHYLHRTRCTEYNQL